jgi:hypothetical protein
VVGGGGLWRRGVFAFLNALVFVKRSFFATFAHHEHHLIAAMYAGVDGMCVLETIDSKFECPTKILQLEGAIFDDKSIVTLDSSSTCSKTSNDSILNGRILTRKRPPVTYYDEIKKKKLTPDNEDVKKRKDSDPNEDQCDYCSVSLSNIRVYSN